MENKLTLSELKKLKPSWDNLVKCKYFGKVCYITRILDDGIHKPEAWIIRDGWESETLVPLENIALTFSPKKKRKVYYRYVSDEAFECIKRDGYFSTHKEPIGRWVNKIKIVVCNEDKE